VQHAECQPVRINESHLLIVHKLELLFMILEAVAADHHRLVDTVLAPKLCFAESVRIFSHQKCWDFVGQVTLFDLNVFKNDPCADILAL